MAVDGVDQTRDLILALTGIVRSRRQFLPAKRLCNKVDRLVSVETTEADVVLRERGRHLLAACEHYPRLPNTLKLRCQVLHILKHGGLEGALDCRSWLWWQH